MVDCKSLIKYTYETLLFSSSISKSNFRPLFKILKTCSTHNDCINVVKRS